MTELEKVLKGNYTKHAVGSYNSDVMDTYGNGAKCGEAIDNFTLVEVKYDAEGNETCVSLTDATKEGLLICTPETRHFESEQMDSFYNGTGEMARLAYLSPNKRFQTSAFTKDDSGKAIFKGQKVHFDPTTKKYIISNGTATNAAYATAFNKFVVQEVEDDVEYTIDGLPMIMLRAVAK